MITWLHTNLPDPVAFSLGGLTVHWYGLLIVLAGMLGFFVALKISRWYDIDKEVFFDLVFYAIIGAIVGARLYYVIYAWEFYKDNLLDIFKLWEGGLAIHGVILGGVAVFVWYARKKKLSFWTLADVAVVGLAIGQAFGRWGNYFNQEIFGRPTELPWGIPISVTKRPFDFLEYSYFHPTFLYESLLMIAVAGVLFGLHYLRKKKNASWLPQGSIFLVYLMLYAVIRFGMEFLRLDYSLDFLGLRWAQWFSVLLFVVAAVLFVGCFKIRKSVKITEHRTRLPAGRQGT
jgi:phosphatidylglycerol:prolipoprotein diacylglycerol transferase